MRNIYTRIARDEYLRETVSHGSEDYPFSYYYENVWDFDLHCIDWHWHPELEFVYVEKGTMTVMAGTDCFELSAGSGLFVNSQVIHCFTAEAGDVIIPNIVFSPRMLAAEDTLIWQKYVRPILSDSAPWQIFSPEVAWQAQILGILKEIFEDQEMYAPGEKSGEKPGKNPEKRSGNGSEEKISSGSCPDEMATYQKLIQLWNVLYHHTKINNENEILCSTAAGEKAAPSVSHQAQLQVMMQYIQNNYRESLTLEEIADSVHISKSSALKLFAAYLHVSPVAYLIRCRLHHAAELLTDTEETLTVIAQRTGFGDAAYFCRKFKELYHMTPGEYRRK